MSGHTPGPWAIRKGDEWTRDVVTDHGELPDGSRNHWNVASANIQREECADNLRLISAAPDLLEALDACMGTLSVCFPNAPVDSVIGKNIVAARAAIAKATREAT